MKKINVIHFNNIKKSFILDGLDFYLKRLKNYINIKIIYEKKIKTLNKYFNRRSYNISLSENGKQLDSLTFAKTINDKMISNDIITFFIGSPVGLSNDFCSESDLLFSFSKLTFTSDLAVLLLTEQLYRTFTIINNHPYHKM